MAQRDFYASPVGAAYSAYMERQWVSRPIAKLVWGGDTAAYYESMRAIEDAPEGATIVDCPCGAGPAFRAIRPDAHGRYVAVDFSPAMLGRARRRAERRGVGGIEFVRATATELPLDSSSADLFVSYWGLHCFPDPAGAIAEAARVLKPNGRLVGATFVSGREYLRQRLFMRPHRGDFGPMGSEADVDGWLAGAGFRLDSTSRSGAFLFFDARLR